MHESIEPIERLMTPDRTSTLADIESVWGRGVVTCRADLKDFIEHPLFEACEMFYDKNIKTISSSANRNDIELGEAYILIDFDSLSPENQKIGSVFAQPVQDGGHRGGGKILRITIPVKESTTVGEISDRALEIAGAFKKQRATWIRTFRDKPVTLEQIRDNLSGPEAPEYHDPTADFWKRNGFIYDPENKVFHSDELQSLYHDSETGLYYENEEQFKKANEVIE